VGRITDDVARGGELARTLPRLREDFERSRDLAGRAVARARKVADEAMATRRVLQARLDEPRETTSHDAEIWTAAARELVRVTREHDRKLGLLAHELRQPLAAALAAERLLNLTAEPASRARAREVLGRQLLHLAELIDNLLEYSRTDLTAPGTVYARLDLRDVAASAIETIESAAVQRGHVVTLTGDSAMVEGDPARLRQAAVNLLQNAVRYTPRNGRIDVSVDVDGDFARLSVRDTGEGIPNERLTAIFEPFVRLSTAGPGLGIGLALVRRIADMHAGSVTVSSEGPNRGSTFVLRLPRADAEA
jgi:signal transduction histidine kinase